MSILLADDVMQSDVSPHKATRSCVIRAMWTVSWLDGDTLLTGHEADAAMQLAEAVAVGVTPVEPLWRLVKAWATTLGVAPSWAVKRITETAVSA